MSKAKAELLSVLKMAEQEQAGWMYKYGHLPIGSEYCAGCDGKDFANVGSGHLPVFREIEWLAFELRDLAVKKSYRRYDIAISDVMEQRDDWDWDFNSKPIEWIIAALLVLDCEDL